MRTLPHVLGRVFNTPLMISAPKLEALLLALPQVLASRGTTMLSEEDLDQRPSQNRRGYQMTPGGVAVLPVRGVLVRRPGQMTPDSTPLQSYDALSRSIQAAMADPKVKALLLDVDSPGGESSAVMDLAQQVRSSTALKPIWSVANDAMFSAAYAIGSAAQRVWVTRTGGTGSIGVMALHADQSQADAKEGVRYTYVHAGDRKIDGNPHGPLVPEAKTRIQAEVDRLHGIFTSTVARHRGMKPEAVQEQQADLYFADDALAAGLADQVGTYEEARGALAELVSPPATRSSNMTAMTNDPAKPGDPPPPQPQPADPPPPAPQPDQPSPPPQREATPEPRPLLPPTLEEGPHAQVTTLGTAADPAPADNVFHLDVAQVTDAQRRLDIEIAAACRVAKLPHLTEEMIASSMTVQQVQAELLRRMAAATDSTPVVAFDTTHRPEPARQSLANLGREAFAARVATRR
jgi:capsid assembly protease